jgi:exo-beta-1,3-glucanase (GH17 family)
MLRSVLLFALVAATITLVWYGMGRPVPMPPSPLAEGERLPCVSYAPFHGEQAPFTWDLHVLDQQIADDLERLSKVTSCVRTYSAANAQGRITKLAGRYGLKVLQGIWIGWNLADNRREINAGLKLARLHPEVVQAIIVGNEVLLRGELPAAKIKTYLQEVRQRSGLPVTYADVWEFWLKASELAPVVDFVTIHILPYWEDEPVPASEAAAHVEEIRAKLAAAFPGKEILVGEVGWPSAGRMRGGALPSPANQARVLQGVVEAAKKDGWAVNLIEAFDQPWKRLLEGTVGGYWGMFDDTHREAKFHWGEPVSNHPRWQLEAGLGIGAACLVFLAGWWGGRDRKSHPLPWPSDLAIAGVALSSGLVFGWAVVSLTMESPELGDRLRAVGLLVLALAVPMTAALAIARGSPLPSFGVALNPPFWRGPGVTGFLLACLFAATMVAALHVAMGLVFDPRYKDFPLAALTGPVAALAVVACADRHTLRCARSRPGVAERVVALVLTGLALFVIVNEGIANWQALWFAALLVVLALSALEARPAQD